MILNFSGKIDIDFRLGPIVHKTRDEVNVIKVEFNFCCLNDLHFYKYLVFNNLDIKPDLVIKTDGQGRECNFIIVKHIFKYLNDVYFAIQKMDTICFDDFLFSFEVELTTNFDVIKFEDIVHCLEHTSFMYFINMKMYVVFNDYYYFDNEN